MGNEIILHEDNVKIVYSLEEDRYYANNYLNALDYLSNPLTFCFHIGYKCNLKCPFCLSPFESIHNEKIDYDSICKFIIAYNIKRVVISGGEPLLYLNELPILLKHLRKIGCYTIVSTNGTLPYNNIEKYLDLIDWFDISLPATNSKLYCQIRGGDHFESVIKFIHELIIAGSRVRLSYMLSESNLHDVSRFPPLAVSLGIKNIRITHTYQSKTGDLVQHLQYQELKKTLNEYNNLVIYLPLDDEQLKMYHKGYLVVRFNGELYLCNTTSNNYIGTLKNGEYEQFINMKKSIILNQAKLFIIEKKEI